MKKWDSDWANSGWSNIDNYWAGAKKACDDIGMSLPDKSKLQSIHKQSWKDSSLGLPRGGYFWSSSEYYAYGAYLVTFDSSGSAYFSGKNDSDHKVLCVGD